MFKKLLFAFILSLFTGDVAIAANDPTVPITRSSLAALVSLGSASGASVFHVIVQNAGTYDWQTTCLGTADGLYFVAPVPAVGSGCWALQYPTANLTPLGSLANYATFTSLSGFTANGTTPSVSGGQLHFSGGVGNFTQSLDFNYIFQSAQWSQTLDEIAPTPGVSTVGVGPGIKSSGASSQTNLAGLVYLTSGGAFDGQVCLQNGGALVLCSGASSTIAFSAGDKIRIKLARAFNVVTVEAFNVTTGSPIISVTYPYEFKDGTTIILPNIGKPGISNFGGTIAVSAYSFSSLAPKGVNMMFVGDSKFSCYYAGDYASCAANLLSQNFKVSIEAGGGDTTADILTDLPNIIAQHPQTVLLQIGRNDLGYGIPLATIKTNFASIVTQLTAAGIKVFPVATTWETAVNQTTFDAWIIATYPSSVITSGDAGKPMLCEPNSVLTPSYVLSSDNIHPTGACNAIEAYNFSQAYLSFIGNAPYRSYYDFLTVINTRNGNLVPPKAFTPAVAFGGASVGVTGTQVAQYTKWNSGINFQIRITLTSKGSSTGIVTVGGLPEAETTGIAAPCTIVPNSNFDASITNILCLVNANSTSISLWTVGAGGVLTQLTNAKLTNTSDMFINGFYYGAH